MAEGQMKVITLCTMFCGLSLEQRCWRNRSILPIDSPVYRAGRYVVDPSSTPLDDVIIYYLLRWIDTGKCD